MAEADKDAKLDKLCEGARSIGPGVSVRFEPSELDAGRWSVLVVAGAAILVSTDFLPLGEAIEAALRKLATISSRMMAAVRLPEGNASDE